MQFSKKKIAIYLNYALIISILYLYVLLMSILTLYIVNQLTMVAQARANYIVTFYSSAGCSFGWGLCGFWVVVLLSPQY